MKKLTFLVGFVFIFGISFLSNFVPLAKAGEPLYYMDCYYPEVGRGFCTNGSYLICHVTAQYCFAYHPS